MRQISTSQKLVEIVFYVVTYPVWILRHKYHMHKILSRHENMMAVLKIRARAERRAGKYAAIRRYFSMPERERFLSTEQLQSVFRKPLGD